MTSTLSPSDSTVHEARPPFQASQRLADDLQQIHVDLIDLHLVGKQLHWNVVGKNFRDTHLVLDEVVEAAREFSDTVAERMRAIYITPDGRAATVAAKTSLPGVPSEEVDTAETVDLITAALYATAGTARRIHDDGRRGGPDLRRHPAHRARAAGAARLDDRLREPDRQPEHPAPDPRVSRLLS